MSAQDSIDEIRKSRVIGSVKIEDEKSKVKTEDHSISSNISGTKRAQPDSEGHCCKHCPHAKCEKSQKTTADPDNTLPDLPEMESTTSENITSPVTATEHKSNKDVSSKEDQTAN